MHQAKRLKAEFGAVLEWRGFELFPDELEWPAPHPAPPDPPDKPPIPTRFELLLAAEQMEMPKVDRPRRMRTHNAHEAVEFAKTEGVADQYVEMLYRAYWEQGLEINSPAVLEELSRGTIRGLEDMMRAIAERRFKHNIVGFDEPAHRQGVYNVPTFFIRRERLAEQPLRALKRAIESALEPTN